LGFPEDPNEGWQLTQGYRTKSVRCEQWPVATESHRQGEPGAVDNFRTGRTPGDDGRASKCSAEGKAFLVELRSYLEDSAGVVTASTKSVTQPGGKEPAIPLNTIQGYLRLRDEDNPELSLDRAAKRREDLDRAGPRSPRQ